MAKKDEVMEKEPELMQEENLLQENEQELVSSEGDESSQKFVETEGIRARRGLMPKQLLPDPEFINKNIVAGGKGTRATLGRIYGVVTSAQRKVQTLPDGSPNETIVCVGVLNMESYITGEVSQGSNVYLPMAYAEKVETAFKLDPRLRVVEIDCDIGVEATGKTIPYEWVITAFREGEAMAVLKRIKGNRRRPENLLIGANGETKQLTGPTK